MIRVVKPECHLNDGLRDSWRDDIDDRSCETAVELPEQFVEGFETRDTGL